MIKWISDNDLYAVFVSRYEEGGEGGSVSSVCFRGFESVGVDEGDDESDFSIFTK